MLDVRPALDHSDHPTHPWLAVAAMTHIANPQSGDVPHVAPAVAVSTLDLRATANTLGVTRFPIPGSNESTCLRRNRIH